MGASREHGHCLGDADFQGDDQLYVDCKRYVWTVFRCNRLHTHGQQSAGTGDHDYANTGDRGARHGWERLQLYIPCQRHGYAHVERGRPGGWTFSQLEHRRGFWDSHVETERLLYLDGDRHVRPVVSSNGVQHHGQQSCGASNFDDTSPGTFRYRERCIRLYLPGIRLRAAYMEHYPLVERWPIDKREHGENNRHADDRDNVEFQRDPHGWGWTSDHGERFFNRSQHREHRVHALGSHDSNCRRHIEC